MDCCFVVLYAKTKKYPIPFLSVQNLTSICFSVWFHLSSRPFAKENTCTGNTNYNVPTDLRVAWRCEMVFNAKQVHYLLVKVIPEFWWWNVIMVRLYEL